MVAELTPEQNTLLDILISEQEARISDIEKSINETNVQLIVAQGALEECKRQLGIYKRKRGIADAPQLSEVLKSMGIDKYDVSEVNPQGG